MRCLAFRCGFRFLLCVSMAGFRLLFEDQGSSAWVLRPGQKPPVFALFYINMRV